MHNWHVDTLDNSPLFERIENDILEKDPFLAYMKNTDEARKVIKINGKMYYAAWKRITPKIFTIKDLISKLKCQKNYEVEEDNE